MALRNKTVSPMKATGYATKNKNKYVIVDDVFK